MEKDFSKNSDVHGNNSVSSHNAYYCGKNAPLALIIASWVFLTLSLGSFLWGMGVSKWKFEVYVGTWQYILSCVSLVLMIFAYGISKVAKIYSERDD